MSDSTRRDFLKFLAAAPLAEFAVAAIDLERASVGTRATLERLAARGQQYTPVNFTPEQWRTVRVLVDLVIPRDERSGSATEAGVPEFMDFMLGESDSMKRWMAEGLTWVDTECQGRFGIGFAQATPAQHAEVLDEIAWPRRARPELQAGVRFFNSFRNLTASGFWSSRMGVEDLQYIGNTVVPVWNGCPPPALEKLGVSYTEE